MVKKEISLDPLIVSREIASQHREIVKRAEELAIANRELAYQNEQKDKCAAELLIANRELAFQNLQKDKRAAELVIANKELAFKNEEKEKRATELGIANKELAFQQNEKKKRAVELIHSYNEVDTLEKRVEERTEDLESFSYAVSHDLRTPLRAINGYATMLEEDYCKVLDTEGKRFLNEIKSNTTKMGVLIDDLLTFSRLGRKALAKSPVDMNALVANVLSEINQSTPYRDEIKCGNLLPAVADNNLMRHVFTNLLSNAIKYSSKNEKPVIEIQSERKNGSLIYAVSDNGVGFDMQYVHKLFGVFQRLHSAEEFSGTGVGLAVVQRIINKHDGEVWAKSKEGQGATFYFSLPEIDKTTLNND